ncbi:MAG: sprT domain-containing protein [Winogradskyella sp.]|uniref:SprT-like domain-containing protein n=1 Tax=Winogradskyella sp. TaxID=1883156 RepID=UPI000F3AC54C|nr:SprT-like domain-containing protein [Winogradskyella sp.]RNC83456.1 MAG: sprT domain-containing protein [Winogradskyella sp.]
MDKTVINHIPSAAVNLIQSLIENENLVIKIKQERKTRHGDYKKLHNGKHQITVNSNLNIYRFLITLVHEIAHLKAYQEYGLRIKPHGKEWKKTFQHLMLPFLNPDIFPPHVLPLLAQHFKNPKASSDTDTDLALALKQYNPSNNNKFVFELDEGVTFKLYNGRIFRKGLKRRKRFECIELSTGKLYLFNPNAEVEILE